MSEPKYYPVLGAPQAALVVLYTEDADRRVLAVNEKGKGLSFPGGKLEPGESPRDCAVRELYKETGVQFPRQSLVAAPMQVVDGTTIVHAFHAPLGGMRLSEEWLYRPIRLVYNAPQHPPIRYPRYNMWLLEHIEHAAGIAWP